MQTVYSYFILYRVELHALYGVGMKMIHLIMESLFRDIK